MKLNCICAKLGIHLQVMMIFSGGFQVLFFNYEYEYQHCNKIGQMLVVCLLIFKTKKIVLHRPHSSR